MTSHNQFDVDITPADPADERVQRVGFGCPLSANQLRTWLDLAPAPRDELLLSWTDREALLIADGGELRVLALEEGTHDSFEIDGHALRIDAVSQSEAWAGPVPRPDLGFVACIAIGAAVTGLIATLPAPPAEEVAFIGGGEANVGIYIEPEEWVKLTERRPVERHPLLDELEPEQDAEAEVEEKENHADESAVRQEPAEGGGGDDGETATAETAAQGSSAPGIAHIAAPTVSKGTSLPPGGGDGESPEDDDAMADDVARMGEESSSGSGGGSGGGNGKGRGQGDGDGDEQGYRRHSALGAEVRDLVEHVRSTTGDHSAARSCFAAKEGNLDFYLEARDGTTGDLYISGVTVLSGWTRARLKRLGWRVVPCKAFARKGN